MTLNLSFATCSLFTFLILFFLTTIPPPTHSGWMKEDGTFACDETLLATDETEGPIINISYVNLKRWKPTKNKSPTIGYTHFDVIKLFFRKDGTLTKDGIRLLVGCSGRQNFTLKQLQIFYDRHHAKYAKYMSSVRNIPICIFSKEIQENGLNLPYKNAQRFLPVLKDIERINYLDVDITKESYGKWKPLKWYPHNVNSKYGLESIKLSRLITEENDYKWMRQWAHVKLTFLQEIDGVMIQAMEGQLGIPSSLEYAQFPCEDGSQNVDFEIDYPDFETVPCRYRPRTSFRHPQVLVIGGSNVNRRKEFRFHFNWMNVQCQETLMIQFLIVIVENADTIQYKTIVSPVYELLISDTADGIPTPFYPSDSWKSKMKCDTNSGTEKLYDEPMPENDEEEDFVEDAGYSTTEDIDSDSFSEDYSQINQVNHANPHDASGAQISKDVVVSRQTNFHREKRQLTAPHTEVDFPECMNLNHEEMRNQTPSCQHLKHCAMGLFSVCYKYDVSYNVEFDHCITGKTNTKRDNDLETCPPGPFYCTLESHWLSANNWDIDRKNTIDIFRNCPRDAPLKKCSLGLDLGIIYHRPAPPLDPLDPLAETTLAPTITEDLKGDLKLFISPDKKGFRKAPGIDPEVQAFQKKFEKKIARVYREHKRTHGWMMIFGFFVLLPCSTYFARYFKETPGISCFGIRTWLMTHIILAYISLTFVILSIVASLGNAGKGIADCDNLPHRKTKASIDLHNELVTACNQHQRQSSTISHMVFGSVSVILYVLSMAVGWARPKQLKSFIIGLHCLAGYISQVLAAILIFVVNDRACFETKIIAGVILFFWITMMLGGFILQLQQDNKLQLERKRKWIPVPEVIEIRTEKPPLHNMKLYVLLIAAVLLIACFIVVLVSHVKINSSDKHTGVVINHEGLFFEEACTSLNETILYMFVHS